MSRGRNYGSGGGGGGGLNSLLNFWLQGQANEKAFAQDQQLQQQRQDFELQRLGVENDLRMRLADHEDQLRTGQITYEQKLIKDRTAAAAATDHLNRLDESEYTHNLGQLPPGVMGSQDVIKLNRGLQAQYLPVIFDANALAMQNQAVGRAQVGSPAYQGQLQATLEAPGLANDVTRKELGKPFVMNAGEAAIYPDNRVITAGKQPDALYDKKGNLVGFNPRAGELTLGKSFIDKDNDQFRLSTEPPPGGGGDSGQGGGQKPPPPTASGPSLHQRGLIPSLTGAAIQAPAAVNSLIDVPGNTANYLGSWLFGQNNTYNPNADFSAANAAAKAIAEKNNPNNIAAFKAWSSQPMLTMPATTAPATPTTPTPASGLTTDEEALWQYLQSKRSQRTNQIQAPSFQFAQ